MNTPIFTTLELSKVVARFPLSTILRDPHALFDCTFQCIVETSPCHLLVRRDEDFS